MRWVMGLLALGCAACGTSHGDDGSAGAADLGARPDGPLADLSEGTDGGPDCSLWTTRGCPFSNADTALPSGWLRWVVADRAGLPAPREIVLRIDPEGRFHLAFADGEKNVHYAVGTPALGFRATRVAVGGVRDVTPSLALCDSGPVIAFAADEPAGTWLARGGPEGWALEPLPFDPGEPAHPLVVCDERGLWAIGQAEGGTGAVLLTPAGELRELPGPFYFGGHPATQAELVTGPFGLGALIQTGYGTYTAGISREGRSWDWVANDEAFGFLRRGGAWALYESWRGDSEAERLRVQRAPDAEPETLPIEGDRFDHPSIVQSASGITHVLVDDGRYLRLATDEGTWRDEIVDETGHADFPSMDLDGERVWFAYRIGQSVVVATDPDRW